MCRGSGIGSLSARIDKVEGIGIGITYFTPIVE